MIKKWLFILFFGLGLTLQANDLATVGVTLLRTIDPTLTGSGVRVAQPEAAGTNSPPPFEVNPAAVGQPQSLFAYFSDLGSATNFPNSIGTESTHANDVGGIFYGTPTGVAPGVSHVDNYDADSFINNIVVSNVSISAKIVNQSFVGTTNQQKQIDAVYDNYAAAHNTLFVSGGGNVENNGGKVSPPATCYNGVGVAVLDGGGSLGPTFENGRSKPDITAPGGLTSFSTPYVSGSAAILVQAGLRGDGGTSTNDATDIRTLKALLLNGAIKPLDWTNGPTTPLDTRYGAGVVNVFNSYKQLAGGKRTFIESTTTTLNGSHFPGSSINNLSGLVGWDFATINTTPSSQDRANHYYFQLTNPPAGSFSLTATLVWNRQTTSTSNPQTNLNNLDLFLYNASNSNLISASTSVVDNVEHIYLKNLPSGRYDLQVLKHGGSAQQSALETYALAFEIFTMPLSISRSGTNSILSWPIAPTGFVLQSTTNLNSPVIWENMNTSILITNNQNIAIVNATTGNRFYRLRRP